MVSGRLASSLAYEAPPSVQIDELLDSVIELIRQFLGANKCSLMLLRNEAGDLAIKKARGLDEKIISQARVKLGDGIAGRVALHRQPVLAKGPDAFPEMERRYSNNYTTQSFISVPVIVDNSIGVLNAADKHNGRSFDHLDLIVLQRIATLMGELLALQETIQIHEEIELIDPVTGLGNWRFFERRLSQEMARANRYSNGLSLVIVDIEGLIDRNDRWMGTAWNQALLNVGRCLEQEIRRSDVAARTGNAEFAIILPRSGTDTAETVAERIISSMSRVTLPAPVNNSIKLSVVLGISSYPSLALDEEQLISQARSALYMAEGTPSRIQVWHSDLENSSEARRLNIPYLPAPVKLLNPDIARLIPLEIARRYCCVPVGYARGHLAVAMLDPTDKDLVNTLRAVTRLTIDPVISSRTEITIALNRLAEILGKQAAADIVVRNGSNGTREMKIAFNPLFIGANVERVMREVSEACSTAKVRIGTMETYALTAVTSATGTLRLLKSLRAVESMLIESDVTEFRATKAKRAQRPEA